MTTIRDFIHAPIKTVNTLSKKLLVETVGRDYSSGTLTVNGDRYQLRSIRVSEPGQGLLPITDVDAETEGHINQVYFSEFEYLSVLIIAQDRIYLCNVPKSYVKKHCFTPQHSATCFQGDFNIKDLIAKFGEKIL